MRLGKLVLPRDCFLQHSDTIILDCSVSLPTRSMVDLEWVIKRIV